MNATETIRKAAFLIRQRAKAATPSPTQPPYGWSGHSGSIGAAIFGGPAEGGYRTSTVLAVVEECEACSPPSEADVQHIIGWHPAVALAVANWLDACAESNGVDQHALAVARAYLGGAR